MLYNPTNNRTTQSYWLRHIWLVQLIVKFKNHTHHKSDTNTIHRDTSIRTVGSEIHQQTHTMIQISQTHPHLHPLYPCLPALSPFLPQTTMHTHACLPSIPSPTHMNLILPEHGVFHASWWRGVAVSPASCQRWTQDRCWSNPPPAWTQDVTCQSEYWSNPPPAWTQDVTCQYRHSTEVTCHRPEHGCDMSVRVLK